MTNTNTPDTTPHPNRVSAEPPELTVIGPDTTIKGEMFFEKSARILGTFEGRITAQGEVQIGQSARCAAAVEAQRVVVDGSVNGPIHAHERLTLTANAQVRGDITAGTLVVAEGASFVGQCSVGPRAQELDEQGGANPPSASLSSELKPALATPVDLTPPWANRGQPHAQAAGEVA